MKKYALLGIVLVFQGLRFATFYSLEGHFDLSYQIHAASNWCEGHGFSVMLPLESLDQEPVYKPLIGWPPAYSTVLNGVNYFVQDWMLSARIVRGLALLLVLLAGFWVWAKVMSFWRLASGGWLLALFYGFSFAPFYYPEVTGLICFGLLLVACGAWLEHISNELEEDPDNLSGRVGDETSARGGLCGGIGWLVSIFWLLFSKKSNNTKCKTCGLNWAILASICMGLTPWFRFAYLPLLAVIPGSLFVLGFVKKESIQTIAIKVGLTGFIEVLLFIPLWLHQQAQTGALSHLAYRAEAESLDLGKLLSFDPFPTKAFVYANPDAVAARLPMIPSWIIGAIFAITSIAVLLYVLVFLWKNRNEVRIPAILLGATNVVMLIYLSLRYPYETHFDDSVWTYVQETRYYLPVMLMMHLVVLSSLLKKGNIRRVLLIGLLAWTGLFYSIKMGQVYLKHDKRNTQQSVYDLRLHTLTHHIKAASNEPVYFVYDKEEGFFNEEIYHIIAAYGARPITIDAVEASSMQQVTGSMVAHLKSDDAQRLRRALSGMSFEVKEEGERLVLVGEPVTKK